MDAKERNKKEIKRIYEQLPETARSLIAPLKDIPDLQTLGRSLSLLKDLGLNVSISQTSKKEWEALNKIRRNPAKTIRKKLQRARIERKLKEKHNRIKICFLDLKKEFQKLWESYLKDYSNKQLVFLTQSIIPLLEKEPEKYIELKEYFNYEALWLKNRLRDFFEEEYQCYKESLKEGHKQKQQRKKELAKECVSFQDFQKKKREYFFTRKKELIKQLNKNFLKSVNRASNQQEQQKALLEKYIEEKRSLLIQSFEQPSKTTDFQAPKGHLTSFNSELLLKYLSSSPEF